MAPEFNPQKTLDDAIAQAKGNANSALWLGGLLLAGVLYLIFRPGRR